MTEPLTPLDCDCRGLPFMPLEVPRLLDSDLVALSTGDEFKAALLIWAKSWSQVPAASMPDDDRILARAAGYPLAEWMGLRDMALRGWVKCTDGRLYHPVVADLALAAQAKRKGQAEKANSRWNKVRAAKAEPPMPPAPKVDADADAAASKTDAELMQGKGTVEGTEPPQPPLMGGDAEPSKRRKAKRPIPDGFPSAEDVAKAQNAARSAGADVDMAYQAERFRGWSISNDVRKADWDATWGNWARKEVKDAPKRVAVTSTPKVSASERWRRPCRRFKSGGYWDTIADGPKPGKPGCEVPAEVLAEFGLVPDDAELFPAVSPRSAA